jgi:hypothetical protein
MAPFTRMTEMTPENVKDYVASFSAEVGSAVQCSAVQCSAVRCSAVQCSAVQSSAVG